MHQPDDLLTITEAAAILRAPVATLRYWRHLGTGPDSIKVGRRILHPYGDPSRGCMPSEATRRNRRPWPGDQLEMIVRPSCSAKSWKSRTLSVANGTPKARQHAATQVSLTGRGRPRLIE